MIAADEPPAFSVVNPDGTAPLVLTCDHASPYIARCFDQLGLDEDALRRHIAWDIGCAAVAESWSVRFDAPLVRTNYSRLIIDPNRPLGHPTSIPEVSEHIIIPGNRSVSPAQAAARAEHFFWPYHRAIDAASNGMLERGVVPTVVSVHSFTPVYHGVQRPWHVGVLWRKDPRLAMPLLARLRAMDGLCVGDNQPYSAHEGVGYSICTHAEEPGFPHALLEIRQDLIESADGQAQWSEQLGDVLEDVLRELPSTHPECELP